MTDDEMYEVERIVNEKIRENIQLDEKRNVPIEEAKNMGAMALFGEKYGDNVRVITFNKDYSVELCGGIHVPATGHIGLMKITSESSIAAGVRRIEAITAQSAQDYFNKQEREYNEIKSLLKDPKDAKVAITSLLDERNSLLKAMESINAERAQQVKNNLIGKVQLLGNVNTIIEKVSIPNADALKTIAFELKNQVENLFMILAGDIDGKPQIAVVVSENLVKEKDLHAGNIVRELAKEIKGGGGGQPFYATAGGKDINGLDSVIVKGKALTDGF
jgi:alanyl-tRNA synthetase